MFYDKYSLLAGFALLPLLEIVFALKYFRERIEARRNSWYNQGDGGIAEATIMRAEDYLSEIREWVKNARLIDDRFVRVCLKDDLFILLG